MLAGIAVPIGLLIGLSLGALGGGSILTVPALVYLLHQQPHAATTGSLIIVGITAVAAMAAVYGGVRLATHHATRTSQLPLGPFILLGTLAALALLQCRFPFLMSLPR
ncbi:MAG: hypothetical protein ACRDOI_23765 [Trebonia sp.]